MTHRVAPPRVAVPPRAEAALPEAPAVRVGVLWVAIVVNIGIAVGLMLGMSL